MHSNDWSRLLTERQREVLSIVVENKVYRNRDSKIPELAAQMGIAPAAVAKHLLEIEKTALLNVVVSPSEQGKRVYERLELEPRPENKQTAEALDRQTITILRFLRDHPDASSNEIAEELRLSDYTTGNSLRVLIAIQLVTKQRGAADRRGRRGRRAGRRNGGASARCGRLRDGHPREAQGRGRAGAMRRRRERVRPPFERPFARRGMDRAARGGGEVRRAEREMVLHHPPPRVCDRPRRVRPLDCPRRGGRWSRAADRDEGDATCGP